MNDMWKAIEVIVSPDPMHPQRYSVEFRPDGSMQAGSLSGEHPEIPSNMVVTVQDEGALKAIAYSHTASPIPGLGQADYDERAIQAVSEYRLQNFKKPSAE